MPIPETAPPPSGLARSLLLGALIWMLLALVLLALRGVRWDENHEFAQVLTGQVVYPVGHPLPVYLSKALSLQTHVVAEWMRLGMTDIAINALRNWLYLCATVLPAFLFGATLGRSVLWGHVAALAMLQGWMLEFDGSYPHSPWPTLYSNGHLGTGWALLALYALLQRNWFWAVLLAGLLPAVHIGQAAPLGLLCLGYGSFALFRRDAGLWRQGLPALAVVTLVWVWLGWRMVDAASLGTIAAPYDVDGDAAAIYQAFITGHDPHRRMPSILAHVAALLCLLQSALAWRGSNDATTRSLYAGIFAYVLAVCALVYPILLVHFFMASDTPTVLLLWMPYRLINHLGPLWLVVTLGMLTQTPRLAWGIVLVFALATLRPLLQLIVPETLFARYLFAGEAFPLLLAGAALAFGYPRLNQRPGWVIAAALATTVLLLPFHQFAAACLMAGALSGLAWQRFTAASSRQAIQRATIAVCVVAIGLLGLNEWRYRVPLVTDALPAEVRTALPLGTLLLAPPETYALQARTGMPVAVDAATASYLTYVPALAPSINHMYEVLYGTSYTATKDGATWHEVWRARPLEQWQALAEEYRIGLVLSPADLRLPLPVVAEMPEGRVYSLVAE